jgi:hypothetical protein
MFYYPKLAVLCVKLVAASSFSTRAGLAVPNQKVRTSNHERCNHGRGDSFTADRNSRIFSMIREENPSISAGVAPAASSFARDSSAAF